MSSTASISTRLVNPVGFSNGWAELTLKKPPPLVPSILIASWEATGPIAMLLGRRWSAVTRAGSA